MKRSRHCTLKLYYLYAAIPFIVFFFLPGAGASVVAFHGSPRAGAIVGNASGDLPLGGATTVLPVNVSNVQNLGAATVMVAYDPAQIVPVQCQRNPGFASGLCNLQFDQTGDGIADTVRFNVISISGVSVAADAQLPMVSISWQATGTAALASSTTLSVTVLTFTNAQGIALPVSAQSGVITFVAAPTVTPTPTSTPTATAPATPTSTATVTPPTTGVERNAVYLPAISLP